MVLGFLIPVHTPPLHCPHSGAVGNEVFPVLPIQEGSHLRHLGLIGLGHWPGWVLNDGLPDPPPELLY